MSQIDTDTPQQSINDDGNNNNDVDVPFPNIHFVAHGDYQVSSSVFDPSNTDAPFHIHLVLWRAAKKLENVSTPQSGTPARTSVEDLNVGPPLTLLVQNSCFDIEHALKKGIVTLYDCTEKVEIGVDDICEEMVSDGCENTGASGGPWVMLHSPVQVDQAVDPSSIDFSPSALLTLPPQTGTARIERHIKQDIAAVLRPVVKSGHTYSIRFPTYETLSVKWWNWGDSKEFLAKVDEQVPRSQSGPDERSDASKLVLTLDDLPPSENGPLRYIRNRSTKPISFTFRVIENWAQPPLLRLKLTLVPVIGDDGENTPYANESHDNRSTSSMHLNDQQHQGRFTITATTTYPLLAPSLASSTTRSSSDSPITLRLSSSQPIAVPFSPTHRRGLRQYTSPDILPPLYGSRPSLTNFHIIDTITGEDLVQNTTRTHPQAIRHRREQFMTLCPGDQVVRQGIRLPYPSELLPNGNRKPREGEPGYRAPDVLDMVPGRIYRITLRDKRFWWRPGTADDLFEGLDDGQSSKAVSGMEKDKNVKESRKRGEKECAKIGRRVHGELRRGLRLVCDDELIVECPSDSGKR